MKRLVLKESKALYSVNVDEIAIMDEVVFLEKEGEPVAAVVPMAEYVVYQAWQEAEARRQARQAEEAAIEREHASFTHMLPDLLKEYSGRVVALYEGQVVAVGDDKLAVWEQARQQVGQKPVYVQLVEYPPKVHKVPYRKAVVDVEL